jgi:hypothetical protein
MKGINTNSKNYLGLKTIYQNTVGYRTFYVFLRVTWKSNFPQPVEAAMTQGKDFPDVGEVSRHECNKTNLRTL